MSRSQLASGVEIVAVPERGLAVRTADGEFFSVRTGDADDSALLSRLSGRSTGEPDAELDRLLGAFDGAGYLVDGPRDAEWPAGHRDILLLGSPVLTEPLAAFLRASGAEPRSAGPDDLADVIPVASGGSTGAAPVAGLADAAPAASGRPADDTSRAHDGPDRAPRAAPGTPADAVPAAVVWCLDGPVPGGLWDAADRLPERGVAWLRCHREGWQACVEPLAAAPGDVTSAHVRARRLAATPAHRELAAYWSGPRTSGAPVQLTAPAAGLLAALLADDLTRWATDAPHPGGLPARRRLRRVDLRTLTVTEHPVLPVPDVTPMPGKAG
ncbi:hypothetical protein [Streptomyces sp. NPDC058625]|uniref:hypothetical protein n=1 Tax=Streptomyces sp. NPDC058625 TaxID=3346564 RepID=UPI003655C608